MMMMLQKRGLSLHPTTIHCAVSGTCNLTGSSVKMALTLDAGVNMNATLGVSKMARNRTDET